MSKRLVTILWIIAGLCAAMVALTKLVQSREGSSPTALSQGAHLLKDLPADKFATIKIEGAENTATISKKDGKWTIEERNGYKANFPKLTRLVRSLLEATVAQNMKGGLAYNERFGMDSEAASQENHGYHLTFLDAAGKEIQSLSVRKSTATDSPRNSPGKYLRLGSEPESIYTTTESFYDISSDPVAW